MCASKKGARMRKRIIGIILTVLMILGLIQNAKVFANVVHVGETKYLERGAQGDYTVLYWSDTRQTYMPIVYSQTYYTDDYGSRRIAYCNNPNADGIGWLPEEYSGYNTTIQYKLDNSQERVWRVFKNGYPYVEPCELGVANADDAYLATKQAAYFALAGRSEDEVYGYFHATEENDELNARGISVVEAIYNLVQKANSSHGDHMGGVEISREGDITIDENDTAYSYQKYRISSNNLEEKVEITNISDAPEGTYTADESGNVRNSFGAGETFKVVIPNESVEKDYNIKVDYKTTCKNYPVFFAKSEIEGTQDYLLSVDKYDDEYGTINLEVNSKTSKFELVKIDEKTNEVIPGVTFNIKYKNGQEIGNYITDENGRIELKELAPGDIIVTETDAPKEYIINKTEREVKLIYNLTLAIEIDNKEAKPKVEIHKEGPQNSNAGEEIRYNFNISNNGNVPLENFTWYDYLPYEKAKITKIATGTYNEELEYSIFYRTTKGNDYKILKEGLNTKKNNFIDLDNIVLEENEKITEVKFEFGTVDENFKSEESPYFYIKVNKDVGDNEEIINQTRLEGFYRGTSVTSEDKVTTVVHNPKTEEQPITQKLPRTGF